MAQTDKQPPPDNVPAQSKARKSMRDVRNQVIAGVVPPELDEARIREAWPSVARSPGLAGLGRALTRTIFLAPLAWLLMSAGYFGKLLPVLARRYTLTNRRVMIRRGWKGKPGQEVRLDAIDEVRIKTDANSDFFRAADLEIISNGQVALTLRGVPEPDGFRHAILNARDAWAPGKRRGVFIPASATK
ncbi:MAG: PH domain-containing protein [Gemmataceae bacterium]|nr:PH domain-containing protein [Gemmataceae bacterium]